MASEAGASARYSAPQVVDFNNKFYGPRIFDEYVRAQIVTTATRLFSGQSYRGIAVDVIAKESNVSKVTMYRYFESKDALIFEVLKRRMNEMEASLKDEIESKEKGIERVRAIFRWHERWFNQPEFLGCVILAALQEYKAEPHIVEIAMQQRDRLFELARQTLADVIHPSVLDQLSRQIVFLLYGAIIYAQTGRKGAAAQDAWECARQLIDFASTGRVQ